MNPLRDEVDNREDLAISPRQMAARIAEHLGQIECDLLALEREVLSSASQTTSEGRAKLQTLDQIVQSVSGLADIVGRLAPLLPEAADPQINAIVASRRLNSLQRALLGKDPRKPDCHVDLF